MSGKEKGTTAEKPDEEHICEHDQAPPPKEGTFNVSTYRQEITLLCGECNWVMSLRAHVLGRNPFFRCGNCRLEVEINSV